MVKRFVGWIEHSRIMAIAVIAMITISLGLSIVVPFLAYSKFHCTSDWADQYSARAQAITDANAARTARLATLNKAFEQVFDTVTQPFDQKKFLAALANERKAAAAYTKADQEATKAAHDNPLPSPPRLRC